MRAVSFVPSRAGEGFGMSREEAQRTLGGMSVESARRVTKLMMAVCWEEMA